MSLSKYIKDDGTCELPNTVTEIENNEFEYADNFREIIIPDSVEKIGAFAFCESNLKYVKFSKSSKLKKIGQYAFSKCLIEGIEIPDSVEEIEDHAFYDCPDFKNVAISKSSKLKKIGKLAFSKCLIEEIEIPDSVEEIEDHAFRYSHIKNVVISKSSKLKKIGKFAFSDCKIEKITIPDSVEEIADYAFWTPNLKYAEFSKSSKLQKIGANAFSDCKIKEITIPASVRYIGTNAFLNCKNLKKVTFCGSEYEIFKSSIFLGCNRLKEIIAPAEMAEYIIKNKKRLCIKESCKIKIVEKVEETNSTKPIEDINNTMSEKVNINQIADQNRDNEIKRSKSVQSASSAQQKQKIISNRAF